MNDLETPTEDQQDIQEHGPPEQLNAGELLKQARVASGLHIAALAVLLKVPVKKLEALEANRLDLLPDPVFTRALASSVCRTLKIDAAPVLALLPQTSVPKLKYHGVGINAPFRSRGDGPGPTVWTQLSRPIVLAGLVLLLGSLVLVFLPSIKAGVNEVKSGAIESQVTAVVTAVKTAKIANIEPEQSAASDIQSNPSVVSGAPMAVTDVTTLVQTTSGATSSVSAANLSSNFKISEPSGASNPALTSSSKMASAVMPAGTASPTFVLAPKSLSANDVIVFTAKGQSWVEATDANGQVVLRRVLNAGEVAGATGVLPLKVVVGRANETQVQIRGKLFDLDAFAKDNVARFEVK